MRKGETTSEMWKTGEKRNRELYRVIRNGERRWNKKEAKK